MKARAVLPAALAGALVAAIGGCARTPPALPGIELTTLLASAEPWTETTDIDLGRPEAGRHLVGGFAAPSRAREAEFLLGVGGGSVLAFRRADTRPFTLRLRGRSIPPEGPEALHVTVRVNGAAVGTLDLAPTPETRALEVPSAVLVPGENRLALEYESAPGVPARASGRRDLVVAWDGVRFGEAAPAALVPGALAAGAGLELPAGGGIAFFLELGGGARLQLERVDSRGGALLAADLACDGVGGEARTVLESHGGPAVVELVEPAAPGAPCRLTLRASGGAGARVEIRGARVRTSAVPPPEAGPESRALPTASAGALRPDVVIYLIDTLRADRLGIHGYPRPVSPAIDRFAREGVVFEQARAQSSWTRPAVATVLTGLDPVRHGAARLMSRLADGAETLAERLHAAGYWTGMATANPNVAAEFGFAQGFDELDCVNCRGFEGSDAELTGSVQRVALAGLDAVARDRPVFLFVHTVEPHAPYRPAEPYRTRFAAGADPLLGERRQLAWLASGKLARTPERERAVGDLYDAEVAFADAGFGAFLDELARRGRLDSTVVLLLSDHGEELFEHGHVEHGRTLFEEQLRIPMIWRLPRGAHGGRRLATSVDQLDVVPTVLELAGLAADPGLPGRSLAGALTGGDSSAERPSVASLDRATFRLESVAFRRAKLIRDLTPVAIAMPYSEQAFDLGADPGERVDLAGDRAVLRGFLAAELRAFRNRWGPPLPTGDAVADEALERQLRALGYLR